MKKYLILCLFIIVSCKKDPIKYSLTVTPEPIDGGLVNPASGIYNAGETVSIINEPNEYFSFTSWSGDWISNNSQIIITMDSDKNIIANFESYDDDRDGIRNAFDRCSNTSQGSIVDNNGCSADQIDTDNDGFADIVDDCPNNAGTDGFACPDTDNDGYRDNIDSCPNQVAAIVDSTGCKIPIFYFDDNGTTVKAIDKAEVGMSESFNDKIYTLVSEDQLREIVNSYNNNDNKSYGRFIVGDISNIVTSRVTNMSYLFKGALIDQFIMGWDVSNVTDMSYMFNESSVGGPGDPTFFYWDVSNVKNFESMFQDAITLSWSATTEDNKLLLYNWDTSSATNMMNMFKISTDNDQLIEDYFFGFSELSGIEDWDVSNVTNMMGIFEGRENFNQNVSSWDVSSVTNMHGMFFNTLFNQDLSNWDVSNVTNMNYMFQSYPPSRPYHPFNQDISNWDVSNVNQLRSMFAHSVFNQNLSQWDTTNVLYCNFFSGDTPYWTLPKPNFDNCLDD